MGRVVCELDFLKSFICDYWTSPHSVESREMDWRWWNLYDRLLDAAKMCFDCPGSELGNFCEEEFRTYCGSKLGSCLSFKLVKRLVDSGRIAYEVPSAKMKNSGRDFSSVDLLSLFLSNDPSEDTMRCCDSAGVQVVTDKSYKISSFYETNTIPVKKDDFFSWKNFLGGMRPINSLVIMDRFLVKKNNDGGNKKMLDNFYPILDSCLPSSLDTAFHLTLFTSDPSQEGAGRVQTGINKAVEDLYDKTIDHLKRTKKKLKVEFGIYVCSSKDMHDRIALSNNHYLECPGGFDLINGGKATKTTYVSLSNKSLCQEEGERPKYENYLALARRLSLERPQHGSKVKNRLLY